MAGELTVNLEGWFQYTQFSTLVHHPGSGEEYHIDVGIHTGPGLYDSEAKQCRGEPDPSITLQLSETTAQRLRDALDKALLQAKNDEPD